MSSCIKQLLICLFILASAERADAQPKPKSHRLPSVDLKERIIWGATCDGPDGGGLSFGGQDQLAYDGQPHTRIRNAIGEWQTIHEELRSLNPLQKQHEVCRDLAKRQKEVIAKLRRLYLDGLTGVEFERALAKTLPQQIRLIKEMELERSSVGLKAYDLDQLRRAESWVTSAFEQASKAPISMGEWLLIPATIREFTLAQIALEKAAEFLAAEPPPRALSPIVYDLSTKRYILFGGDHLDYLTNDTWLFDPAKKQWQQRHPTNAPPPRANHILKVTEGGKIVLSGGYTYTSSTDYVGGQYRDLDDGDWTYDVAKNTWTGGKGVPAGSRTYRTGPFAPEYFLQGPKPDAAAFAERLRKLPANTWVMTTPPQLPRLNRDWGTAVLDPDRDLILRWSGGHSAHGGTDVLHYHLGSNRWELPIPVEFPLGQLYSNTSYPSGFNFNMRPWITGHTYQNYGYDPLLKKMLFVGQTSHCYIYDPAIGDWAERIPKPQGMMYDSCFYTLTLCPTPRGLVCWTQAGKLFRFDAGKKAWLELEQKEAKLPGSVVDNSTVVHDSKRNLIFARKPYGDKNKFDGELQTYDLETGKVGKLSPQGRDSAGKIPYLCQIRYDVDNDLLLVGATLPPDDGGLRRTPAYDCAGNRWVSLKIDGEDPSGKAGRNVSLGLMYDARRKLFWAVDTNSKVFVLRLELAKADLQPF